MSSIIIFILGLQLTPLIFNRFLSLRDAFDLCQVTGMVSMVLACWYIYLTVPRKRYLIKVISMLSLVASCFFLVNYIFIESEGINSLTELVGG